MLRFVNKVLLLVEQDNGYLQSILYVWDVEFDLIRFFDFGLANCGVYENDDAMFRTTDSQGSVTN